MNFTGFACYIQNLKKPFTFNKNLSKNHLKKIAAYDEKRQLNNKTNTTIQRIYEFAETGESEKY